MEDEFTTVNSYPNSLVREDSVVKPQENRYQSPELIDTKPVKKKKGGKFLSKLAAGMAIGLAFGIFAAGGFYATNLIINKDAEVTQTANADVAELEKKVDALQRALHFNGTGSGAEVTNLAYTTVVTDVTDVVEAVMPAMVSITNVYEEKTNYWGRVYTQEAQASGSGIIVGASDEEYFIATNHHVIADAVKLTVQFADGTTAEAHVKGYEAGIDIGVIAVYAADLEKSTIDSIAVAEMGDSDALRIGEPAIAIGNALGYGQSVTTGVISALNREIDLENTSSNLIQTSAAINPGNSGGALLNIRGQVIGINSSKIGATTVEGIGFAIPITEVKDIIGELSSRVTREKVAEDEKGYLGIGCQDYDLTSLGYPAGAYVAKVYVGSPAEAAGIYMGDIITRIDGQSIANFTDLSATLDFYKAGETVKITVTRNVEGKLQEFELDVTLGTKDAIETE